MVIIINTWRINLTKNIFKLNKNDFIKNEYSLSADTYSPNIKLKSQSAIPLTELITAVKKGVEPGSSQYFHNAPNYFVRISDIDSINSTFYTDEKMRKIATQNKAPLLNKGDILYQTASDVGNVCMYLDNAPAYYNSHLLKIEVDIKYKYYVFAFLKSSVSKNFISISGSIKGMDNFRKDFLNKQLIAFPNPKIYINHNEIINYISNLMMNLIDKEFEIQRKEKEISLLIENELSSSYNYKYNYPKISDLKNENRIDANIYTSEYKMKEHNILTYKHGYFYLNADKIKPGKTPKKRIFKNENSGTDNIWITPKNIRNSLLHYETYISTDSSNTLTYNSIILSSIRYVNNGVYIDKNLDNNSYANQNTLIINEFEESDKQISILLFLTSDFCKNLLYGRRVVGTVPILYSSQLARIPIPKFKSDFRKKLVTLFYNEKSTTYKGIDDYIEKEKTRNKDLGIFQLNNEAMRLRNKINMIFDNIINENNITIELNPSN